MKIIEMAGTCDASGDLTLTSTKNVSGYMEKIVMDYKDGDTGADIVVTNEDGTASTPILTKANLGTADAAFFPRTTANKVADGTAFVNWADKILVSGNFKIVISAGGISKNFRFLIYVSDEV